MKGRAGAGPRLFLGTAIAVLVLLLGATGQSAEPPPRGAPASTGTSTATAGASATPAPPPASGPREKPLFDPHPPVFNNPVKWDESWPKFRLVEYILTPILGATVFAARAIPPQPSNWRDVSGFDSEVRNALRLPTLSARNTADDASDLILTLMVNQLLVDATLVAWWGHDRATVGYQMVLMDLEALAFTGAVQALVSSAVSRWRPFRATCVGPKEKQTQDCQDNKQYTSFFSGHTSGAFTTAGLMCMHHLHIPLYGGGAREGITCAASFAAAATVGYLRMAADQHFATDVLVGAAFGTLSGLGLPWLLHYRGGASPAKPSSKKKAFQPTFRVAPTPMGLIATGEF